MPDELKIFKSIDIHATAPEVWNALISPEKIVQYFFGAETITNWEVGTPVLFKHEYEGQKFINRGIVLAYQPNELLSYTYWTAFSNTEDRPENYTIIAFWLSFIDNKTVLTLTQTNFKDEAWYQGLQTGWDMVLDKIKEIAENNSTSY